MPNRKAKVIFFIYDNNIIEKKSFRNMKNGEILMALSANNINNIFLKNYMSQIKNSNSTLEESNTTNIEQEKVLQQVVFQSMLNQMMETTDNPMMVEVLSAALSEENSFTSGDTLSIMSNFNSAVRNANYTQPISKAYSKEIDNNFSSLGLRASKYESNLNPGAISDIKGDYGGKSYGAWQFSSKTGSLNSFINSLKGSHNEFYSKLLNAKLRDGNKYGNNFDAAWTNIALTNRDKFLKVQQNYVKQAYYDKAAQSLKSKYGFDIDKRSPAMKESLWSTVVQHGVGGTLSVFSKLNLNNSDSNIINDLYNERQKVNIYFRSSSERVQQSVYNRFTREKQDMLSMLNETFV